MNKPYTYYLYHIPTGKKYYGARWGNKCEPEKDLWIKYFSSSDYVKALIKEYGKTSFLIEIRKIFDTAQEARRWEDTVHRRLRVVEKDEWLNRSYFGEHVHYAGLGNTHSKGHIVSDELKKFFGNMHKGNQHHKGKFHSPESKEQMRQSHLGMKHDEEWNRKIGEGQSTPVQTPLGIFSSLKNAAKAHNCCRNTIKYRCKSQPSDYKRLNEIQTDNIQ